MQKIGVLVKSEVPDDDEANDGLDALNALLGSWSNDAGVMYTRIKETFALTSSATYTIGNAGSFNTVRPIQIVNAYTSSGGIDYNLAILTTEEYDNISFKGLAGIPCYLVYDNAYPLGNITLYPTPSAGFTLTLLSEKPLNDFPTLDTEAILPDGWVRALIYNLAVDIAPEYGQQPDPSIVNTATKSLGAIRKSTIRSRPIGVDYATHQVNNIYNGWYR